MKFSIEKSDLQSKIQHLHNIVPSKNTMPILTNYLVEAIESENKIKFTATDLEITVIVEFEASISESGKIAISARNFNEIVNFLPESTVHLFVEEDILKIHCGNAKFDLTCAEVDRFPLIPDRPEENLIELDAKMFKKMIDNTSFAVSIELNRPIFTGVLWKMAEDHQMMVATDGKKIAEFTLFGESAIPEEKEKIIPTKGLVFLDKIITEKYPEISVLIESNRVMFNYGNYTIFTHTIEGNFPDYTKAIPENNTNILILNKAEIIEIVKRVSLLSSEDTFKIKLNISAESFTVHSEKRDEGQADETILDYKYEGEPIHIAFNFRYFLAILNVISTDKVDMRFGNSKEPVIFFNAEKDEKYFARFLLMPLRLK